MGKVPQPSEVPRSKLTHVTADPQLNALFDKKDQTIKELQDHTEVFHLNG
jgi:hypothetical protein